MAASLLHHGLLFHAVRAVDEHHRMMEIRNKLVNWRRRRSTDQRPASGQSLLLGVMPTGDPPRRAAAAGRCLFIRTCPPVVCISCHRDPRNSMCRVRPVRSVTCPSRHRALTHGVDLQIQR